MRRWKLFIPLLASFGAAGAEPGSEEDIEWPAYGGAPGGGHYTTASEITKDNVGQLKLAWSHRSGDYAGGANSLAERVNLSTRPTAFVATPIMVADTLYYCTPFSRVFALDPGTGEERWAFDPQVDMSDEPSPDIYGGDRGGHLDYYSSSVVALNAADGTVAWHYQTVHHDIWDYDVASQPTFVDLNITGLSRPAVVQVTKIDAYTLALAKSPEARVFPPRRGFRASH